jgi:hypothetical protein
MRRGQGCRSRAIGLAQTVPLRETRERGLSPRNLRNAGSTGHSEHLARVNILGDNTSDRWDIPGSKGGQIMVELRYFLLSVLSAVAAMSTHANAQEVNGALKLTLNGTLRVEGTGYTTANCKAYAVLIPTTNSAVTVGGAGLLSWLYNADQSSNAHAGFDYTTGGSSITGVKPVPPTSAGRVSGFTCVVNVPYTFTNAVGGQSIAVMYDVSVSDGSPCATGYCPFPPKYPGGHSRQVMQIAVPPSNGGVINLSANLKM